MREPLFLNWPEKSILLNYLESTQASVELTHQIEELVIELCDSGDQLFNSFNSRIAYLYQKRKIDKSLYHLLFSYRENFNDVDFHTYDSLNRMGVKALLELICKLKGSSIPQNLEVFTDYELKEDLRILNGGQGSYRVSLHQLDSEKLYISLEALGFQMLELPVNTIDPKYLDQIRKARDIAGFPIPAYVHQFENVHGFWTFNHIVVFPDYLVDVTSIAECYSENNSSPLKHFFNLFQARLATKYILIGTTVNEFLDELILNPSLNYEQLYTAVFNKYPLPLSLLEDSDFKDYEKATKDHFDNLQKIVHSRFDGTYGKSDVVHLEPSFYSDIYGIQGRLDVLLETPGGVRKIIELKSGKPFRADSNGINTNHKGQAFLYDLLIQSVYKENRNNQCYILYSSQTNNSLRQSIPDVKSKKDLLMLRNSIVLLHYHLAFSNPCDNSFLDRVKMKMISSLDSFVRRDAENWIKAFGELDELEKKYFKHYTYFIAREQLIAKTGYSGLTQTAGLASLWLFSREEKELQFSILADLVIKEVLLTDNDAPVISLENKFGKNLMTSFRSGDTLVFYPEFIDRQGILSHQVYKCTLVGLSHSECIIRLRGRQFDATSLPPNTAWNLEPDSLDRSYLHQYENLYEFARAPKIYRDKILGRIPPITKTHQNFEFTNLNSNISELVKKILSAQDYFLLWGPPGSGKTSILIKSLVEALINQTAERILLLAYTNRAVDEICEAIESIGLETRFDFVRIGSRYAIQDKFQKNLLDFRLRDIPKRENIKEYVESKRIYTATIASIQGKKELFQLTNFDTVIIDEASQILEPNLVGLLSKFRRFILIGDHLQLPAVSAQPEASTFVKDVDLKEMGIKKLSDSFFERMFYQCKKNEWTHAYDMLAKQGRMHQHIMKLPSRLFYNQKLELMFDDPNSRQTLELKNKFYNVKSKLEEVLTSERTIYIPSKNNEDTQFAKTHDYEAEKISYLIRILYQVYTKNNIPWDEQTCGIITPFRAQISNIKKYLAFEGLQDLPIKVDTVERYQGSARDIIIYSCCVHSIRQLMQLSNESEEGLDKRLNVTLTRAREQIIVFGDLSVLSESAIYSTLIKEYYNLELEAPLH
ncbi:MAG: AAA family ATPase [Saprospiraceae bacterium]|nr:AAA family ATPase [Candidatus Vicinibacter affinis]